MPALPQPPHEAKKKIPDLKPHELYGSVFDPPPKTAWGRAARVHARPDFSVSPARWKVGLAWAVVFGLVGHFAAPELPKWADAFREWRWSISHSSGQKLLYLVTIILEIGLTLSSLAVVLGDRYRILPAVGFVFGCMPAIHLQLVAALGRGIKTAATVILVSAYQLWRAARMKPNKTDPEQAAQALIQTMPQDLVVRFEQRAHDPFILKAMITSYVTTKKFELKAQVLEAMTHYFQEHAARSRAASDATRAHHELQTINTQLGRNDDLDDAAHNTKLLEHEAAQAALRGKIDEQKTAGLRQVHERVALRKRIAADRARPIDDNFEQLARQVIAENEDVLIGQARLQEELEARTDITQVAKAAAIEWLQELTAQELHRRMEKKPHSS